MDQHITQMFNCDPCLPMWTKPEYHGRSGVMCSTYISMSDFYSRFRMNANDVSLRPEQRCSQTEGRSFFKSLRFPRDRGFTESRWRSIKLWLCSESKRHHTTVQQKGEDWVQWRRGSKLSHTCWWGGTFTEELNRQLRSVVHPTQSRPHPIALVTLFFLHHRPRLCLLCWLRIRLPLQDCSRPPGLGGRTAGPWTPAGLACLTPSVHAVFHWVNRSGLPGRQDSCWSDQAWCLWLRTLWRSAERLLLESHDLGD